MMSFVTNYFVDIFMVCPQTMMSFVLDINKTLFFIFSKMTFERIFSFSTTGDEMKFSFNMSLLLSDKSS